MNQYELAAVTFIVKAVEMLCDDDNQSITATTKRVSEETKPGLDRVTNVVFAHNGTEIADIDISVDIYGTIYIRHEDGQLTKTRVSEIADYIYKQI